MNPKEAVLGPMSDRVKTDVRLPRALWQRIEDLSDALGIPKNAWISAACAALAVQLAPVLAPGKKREKILEEAKEIFQRIIDFSSNTQ